VCIIFGDSDSVIVTVTPNTAVDKTYTVENFTIDRVHRPSEWRIVAGGKGINVARVYKELGGEAISTGFVGGHNGDFILESLRAEGLKADFVRTKGESRVCIAILDPVNRTQTELNEIGPEISSDEYERLKLKFESLVPGTEFVVLSGSTPPGVPDTIYREMIEIARRYNVPCLLDGNNAPLREGLKALPSIAKPNIHELSAIVGRQLGTIEEVAEAANEFVSQGIDIMVVTLGRDGALAATKEATWRAKSPEIKFVSAVGSGDALAAAVVYALGNGRSLEEALRLGTAAGAANAMTYGAGFCSKEDIYRLAEQVEMERI